MKATPRLRARTLLSFTALAALVALAALACGSSDDGAAGSEARDAAPETAPGPSGDATPDVLDARQVIELPRCAGATYATAPSGAACDPKRIHRQQGLEGTCYGPAVGAGCRSLDVSVGAYDAGALPSGFVCGPPEGDVATCVWSLTGDSAPAGLIDEAALEAACAATITFPSAIVVCRNSGS